MSAFHNIFCTSEATVTADELAEYAYPGWYGEGSPSFHQTATDESGWTRLEMRLPGIRRPIIFLRDARPEAVRPEVVGPAADHLRRSRQVIGIELWPETLDDDAWELLDLLQSFLARRLDGILITDDGIYDADLRDDHVGR